MFIVYSKEELKKIKDDPVLLKKCMLATYGFVLRQLEVENLKPTKETLMKALNVFGINYLMVNYDLTNEEKVSLLPFFANSSGHPIVDVAMDEKIVLDYLKREDELFDKTIISAEFFCKYFQLFLKQKQEINNVNIVNIVKNSAKQWGFKKIKAIPEHILMEFPEILQTLTKKQLNSSEIKPIKRQELQNKVLNKSVFLNDLEDFSLEQSDRDLLLKILERGKGGMQYNDLLHFDGAAELVSKKDFFEKYNYKDFSGWSAKEVKENKSFIQNVWRTKFQKNVLNTNESGVDEEGNQEVSGQFFYEITNCNQQCFEAVLDEEFLNELISKDLFNFGLNTGYEEGKINYLSLLMSRLLLGKEILSDSIKISDLGGQISNCLNGIYDSGELLDFLEKHGHEIKSNFDVFYKNLFSSLTIERFGDLNVFFVFENIISLNSIYELTIKEPDFNKVYLLFHGLSVLEDVEYEEDFENVLLKLKLKTKEKIISEVESLSMSFLKANEIEILEKYFSEFYDNNDDLHSEPTKAGSVNLIEAGKIDKKVVESQNIEMKNQRVVRSFFDIDYLDLLKAIECSLDKEDFDNLLSMRPWSSSKFTTLDWLKKYDAAFYKKLSASNFLTQNFSEDFKKVIILFALKDLDFNSQLFENIMSFLKKNPNLLDKKSIFCKRIQFFDLVEERLFESSEILKQGTELLEDLLYLEKQKRKNVNQIKMNIKKAKEIKQWLKVFFQENGISIAGESVFFRNQVSDLISEKSILKIKQLKANKKQDALSALSMVHTYNRLIKENLDLEQDIKQLAENTSDLLKYVSKQKAQHLFKFLLDNEKFENLCFTGTQLSNVLGVKTVKFLLQEHLKTYNDEKFLSMAANKYWVFFMLNIIKNNYPNSSFHNNRAYCFSSKKPENYEKFMALIMANYKKDFIKKGVPLSTEQTLQVLQIDGNSNVVGASNADYKESRLVVAEDDYDLLHFDEKTTPAFLWLFNLEDECAIGVIKKSLKKYFIKDLLSTLNFQNMLLESKTVFFNKEDIFEIFKDFLKEKDLLSTNLKVQKLIMENYAFLNKGIYDPYDSENSLGEVKKNPLVLKKIIESKRQDYEKLVKFSKCDSMFHVLVCDSNLLNFFAHYSDEQNVKDFIEPFVNKKEDINKYAEDLFDKNLLVEGIKAWGEFFESKKIGLPGIFQDLIGNVVKSSYNVTNNSGIECHSSTWSQSESLRLIEVLYNNNCFYLFGLNSLGCFSSVQKILSSFLLDNSAEQNLIEVMSPTAVPVEKVMSPTEKPSQVDRIGGKLSVELALLSPSDILKTSECPPSDINEFCLTKKAVIEDESGGKSINYENKTIEKIGFYKKSSLVEKILFFENKGLDERFLMTWSDRRYDKYLEIMFLYCLKNKDQAQFDYIMWTKELYDFIRKYNVDQKRDYKSVNEMEESFESFCKYFERLSMLNRSEVLRNTIEIVDSFFKIKQSVGSEKDEVIKSSFRL